MNISNGDLLTNIDPDNNYLDNLSNLAGAIQSNFYLFLNSKLLSGTCVIHNCEQIILLGTVVKIRIIISLCSKMISNRMYV